MLLRVVAASCWPRFGPQVCLRRARRTRPADDGEKNRPRLVFGSCGEPYADQNQGRVLRPMVLTGHPYRLLQ